MLKTFCLPARGCKILTKALRIMKITSLLITIACLHAYAGSNAQITLSEKNAPLHKVFNEIRKQTGFEFVYPESLLQSAGTVTVVLTDATLDEAIKKCLEGKALDYTILEKTVVIKQKFQPPGGDFLAQSNVYSNYSEG